MPVQEISSQASVFEAFPQTERKRNPLRPIGILAPAVVALWVLVDLLARFANPALLNLDPWLVVSKCPPRFSPFSPDQSFSMPAYYGGTAKAANLEPSETGDPILFSTDHLGFRTTPALQAGQTPQVLFFKGDSFTYGVGLSDDQTLANVMTAKWGIPSYNGGRFHDDPEGMPELDWLMNHLPGRPSTLVYTYLEHQPVVAPADMRGIDGRLMRRNPRLEGDLRYLKLLNTFFWELSPTRVVTTRLFKKIDNDVIFPNPNRKGVRQLSLPNGQRLLFRDYEFLLPELDRGPGFLSQTARGFEWLEAECKKRNVRLVVLLLPNRYTLYAPALTGVKGEWTEYLNRLDSNLRARGIETLNGLEVYRSGLETEIATGELSFYREDTHWNPRGVNKIAQALAAYLKKQPQDKAEGALRSALQ